MVIDKPAYEELIDYLTSNKEIFYQNSSVPVEGSQTLEEVVEHEISDQIITLCTQHDGLETNHRSIIIREVDGIVYDIQQVLYEYWHHPVAEQQIAFISEFAALIKNVFDNAIAELMD